MPSPVPVSSQAGLRASRFVFLRSSRCLVGVGEWCQVGLARRRFLWLLRVRPPVPVPPATFPVAGVSPETSHCRSFFSESADLTTGGLFGFPDSGSEQFSRSEFSPALSAFFSGCSVLASGSLWLFDSSGTMFGSVCVEGKKFQLSGGGGGAFPFKLTELSRRKRFCVSLCLEELRWLSVEWVRFCSSKGDPIWVKTFR